MSDRPIHEWNKPSHTAGKPGRMILSVRPDTLGQTYKIILPCRWFARFHASGSVPFPFGVFPFSRISLSKFSCPICLHFRLPPFSHLSGSASGCHFRSGRKGNSGIGRECKVKPPVFGKNLQPGGYYFSLKTLNSLIPTFSSTRNENDRCDRKTHKKNVG